VTPSDQEKPLMSPKPRDQNDRTTSSIRRASAVALVALALVVAAVAVALESETQAEPRVVAPEPIWDGGRVARGDDLSHDFVLRNEGEAVLYVREVRPACGCTVAHFDEAIPPGGEGKVRAVLQTGSFRGPIAKGITVFTNDRRTPILELTMKADVTPLLEVLPGYARYIHVQGSGPRTVIQNLWATDEVSLEILGVESPFDHLHVSHRQAREEERIAEGPARQLVVSATLASEPPVGPLVGDIVVTTNHPRQPRLLVPVAGFVRPILQVSPPAAELGEVSPAVPHRGSVIVTNFGEAPVRVTSVSSDLPGFSSQIQEQQDGRRWTVHYTLQASGALSTGPFQGVLRLHTDSDREPVLEVPVRGVVR
jgi:hypothetical protein